MFIPWDKEGDLSFPGPTLVFTVLQYMVEKLPRAVIIENVRAMTFKTNETLLAHVKECFSSVALFHPHPDLRFPVRGSPESRPALRGGHLRAEGRL